MADVKISELTALTSPDGAEELVVNDSGTTKKITITNATSASLPKAGGTMTGVIAGFESTGIDDNATSTAITIDANENVGIGVTPQANWHSNYDAVAIGEQAVLYAHADGIGNDSATYLGTNVYENSGSKYLRTDKSSLYRQQSGKHDFYVAPSGTADAAISWTTAMTIDNSGNVGIGVVPEAWHSVWSATRIGDGASLTGRSDVSSADLGSNFYINATADFKAIDTSGASRHYMYNGAHYFYVDPPSSAGRTISWNTGFEVLNDGKARAKNGLLFGTDTAAANTLDDYEEGTFTPVLRGSTNAGSFSTDGAHLGRYTKIGDVCTLNFVIGGTLSGATGSYTHFNLPFTVKAGTSATGRFSYVTTPNLNHVDFSSYVNAGQTLGYFLIKTGSAASPVYPPPSSFMPSSVQIYGTVTYQVA